MLQIDIQMIETCTDAEPFSTPAVSAYECPTHEQESGRRAPDAVNCPG